MLASLLWIGLLSTPDAGPQQAREKLKAVGEELKQEQFDVERLLGEEGSLLQAIDSAARDAEAADAALEEAQARRTSAASHLREARAREQVVQAAADARLRVLEPRLRAWQRLSPGRRIELLLSAQGAQEAGRREQALRQILGRDLADVRSTLADLKSAKAERAEVTRLEADLGHRSREAQAAEVEAQGRRSHHAALLVAIREERGLHERAAKELKAAQDHLSQVVAALPAERMESTQFAEARGKLPLPADGLIEVGFGPILNPRFNTTTLQKGIDLRAPAGAPVRAIHRGRVVHAGWLEGYGNILIVDHGDGFFTLFAHLGSVKPQVNDLVDAGEEIGAVGATGSLKGAYLYFEIRQRGTALDPALWFSPAAMVGLKAE